MDPLNRMVHGTKKNPRELRFCGGSGHDLGPKEIRRCPEASCLEHWAWRPLCRACGTPTVALAAK